MKTKEAHPLGIAWVTLVFLSLPTALFFGDYSSDSWSLHLILVGVVSGVVTFSVASVLFWVSQIRPIRMGWGWYRVRSFESARFYRRLGTMRFRAWLLKSPFRALNRDVYLRGRSRRDVEGLLTHVDAAEANHAVGFGAMILLTALYGFGNSLAFIPWLAAFNVAGNVYPILLQRLVRLRLVNVLERGRDGAARPTPFHTDRAPKPAD